MTTATKRKRTAISVDEIRAATAAVGALRQKMTFVLPLTVAERREHRAAKIGPKKLRMVANRLAAAREHRELLPPAFDLRKFERDAGLAGALDECSAAVEEMRVAVQDTFMAVAKRAVVAASAAYAHLQVASTTAQRLKRTVEKITPHANRSSVGEVVPAAVPEPSDSAKASVPAETAIKPTDKAA